MIATLRTLAYTVVFYLGCLIFVPIAGVLALMGHRATLAGSRLWAQFHYACARVLLGVRTEIIGALPQRDAIVALRHESMFEAIETLRVFDEPAVVLKAELMTIPLWGWIARTHGVIPVEREAGAAALRRLLTAARAAVAAGRPIVIFPEGTRVMPGERAPLRPGIAGLYKALGLPVVPVSIDSGRLYPRHGFAKRAGIVHWRVGAPIPPGLPRAEFEARLADGLLPPDAEMLHRTKNA